MRHGTSEEAVAHALLDLRAHNKNNNSHNNNTNNTQQQQQQQGKELLFVELHCGDELVDSHSSPVSFCAGYDNQSDCEYGIEDGEEEEGEYGFTGGSSPDPHSHTSPASASVSRALHAPAAVGQPLTGLRRIDQFVQQIYAAAPAGTVVAVVTQGNLRAMKQLASRKLRFNLCFNLCFSSLPWIFYRVFISPFTLFQWFCLSQESLGAGGHQAQTVSRGGGSRAVGPLRGRGPAQCRRRACHRRRGISSQEGVNVELVGAWCIVFGAGVCRNYFLKYVSNT